MVKIVLSVSAMAAAVLAGSSTDLPDAVAKLMDPTVNPCDDFYKYACGGWYKDAVIPDGASYTDLSFTAVRAQRDQAVQKVVASNAPKLGEFYSACMDTATINSLGFTPIAKDLQAIAAANSTEALLALAAQLSKKGVAAFAQPQVLQDPEDARKNALFASETDQTISLRDIYLDNNLWDYIQMPYKTYIVDVLKLIGLGDAAANTAADAIQTFERQFAGAQIAKDAPQANAPDYYPMTLREASLKYPLTLGSVLAEYGFNTRDGCGGDTIILSDLAYFDRSEALLKSLPADTLRLLITFKLVHFAAPHLSSDFALANWAFFGQFVGSQTVQPTRTQTCTDSASTNVRELVGKYYMEAVFDKASAAVADEVATYVKEAVDANVATAPWMDEPSRANAQAKLGKFSHMLGGPKAPQEYPTVPFNPKTYLENIFSIKGVDVAARLEGLNAPFDKTKWSATATTVNTTPVYNLRANQIVVSAAQLQSPFFSGASDASQNFGAFGAAVFGNDITHAVDKTGGLVDGDGNPSSWWSNATTTAFDTKTQCFEKQYSAFVVKSEETGAVLGNINGKKTLSENVADNAGLASAFHAWNKHWATHESKYTKETAEKVFFLSYAQSYCAKHKDSRLKSLLRSGTKSVSEYRVKGSLQNSADFGRVFKCPTNSNMNPASKCTLWE